MKSVISRLASLTLAALVLGPALAKAEFNVPYVKAMFATPKTIGKCSVVWVEASESKHPLSQGVAGELLVTYDVEDGKSWGSIEIPKDEKIVRHWYSTQIPPGAHYYRQRGWNLPIAAKNRLDIDQQRIHIETMSWSGIMFTGLVYERADIQLDANGNPISLIKQDSLTGGFLPVVPDRVTYSIGIRTVPTGVNCQEP